MCFLSLILYLNLIINKIDKYFLIIILLEKKTYSTFFIFFGSNFYHSLINYLSIIKTTLNINNFFNL